MATTESPSEISEADATFWALTSWLRDIDSWLAGTGGELTPELSAQIDAITEARDRKALGLARYRRFLVGRAGEIKRREKELAARREALERRAASIERYLYDALKDERPRLADADADINWRKLPPKVIVDELAALPGKYLRTRTVETIDADKEALREALLGGTEVPGARLREEKFRLVLDPPKKGDAQ